MRMNSKILHKFDLILKCFTPSEPRWTATELADRLKLPVTTLHGILADMVEMDFLFFSPVSKEYIIGFRHMEMGALHSNNFELTNIALGIMNDLVFEVDCLAGLCVLYKGWMYTATTVIPQRNLAGFKHVGPRLPAHLSAGGLAILAHVPVEVADKYMALERDEIYSTLSVQRNELAHELELTRTRGYSLGCRLSQRGLPETIGAPVFGRNRQIIASLVLVGPYEGFPPDVMQRNANMLIMAANEITLRCGHIGLPCVYV